MVTVVVDPGLGHRRDLRGRAEVSRYPHPPVLPAIVVPRRLRRFTRCDRARRRNRVSYGLAPRAINLPSALVLTSHMSTGSVSIVLASPPPVRIVPTR